MSAHRLTLHNVIRNGHRYASFHSPPVQAQNEPHNEEQTESGRLVDAVLPFVNLVPHRSDPSLFTANFVPPPAWPIPFGQNEADGNALGRIQDICSRGLNFHLPKKKSTAEAAVQTDHSNELRFAERYEKLRLDFENQLAMEMMKDGLTQEAVKHFLHASENGHVDAMNNLADCLFNGTGAKENKREALRLWKQAATLGNTTAMYNLAVCHIGGDGTPVDLEEGLKLMWKAAESENADASFYLILKLIHEKNPEKARRLIRFAYQNEDYKMELLSWIRDKVVDEPTLRILREEIALLS